MAFLTPLNKQEGLSEYSRMLVSELKKLVAVEIFPLADFSLDSKDTLTTLNNFDLVHLQHELAHWGSFTNPLRTPRFFEFCEKIKIPKVVTFHSVDLKGETWKKWGWWGKRRFVQMHKLPQASIVHTQFSKNGLVQMGIPTTKVYVIPIGVPQFSQYKSYASYWSQITDKRIIAIFGFINPDKGYEIVLSVLKNLPADVVFVIAGAVQDQSNQVYLNTLNSLIAQMGLQNRVFITGFLEKEKMLALIQQAEVVLFPRTHVNASLELSLAIALKKPILTSNLPYFMEVNARVPCLEIFELEGDRVENFKKELLRLLDDKNCQQGLSKYCEEYTGAYSWEKVARTTIKVYQSVVC